MHRRFLLRISKGEAWLSNGSLGANIEVRPYTAAFLALCAFSTDLISMQHPDADESCIMLVADSNTDFTGMDPVFDLKLANVTSDLAIYTLTSNHMRKRLKKCDSLQLEPVVFTRIEFDSELLTTLFGRVPVNLFLKFDENYLRFSEMRNTLKQKGF